MSDIDRLADIGLALPAGTRILKASTAETPTEAEVILGAARKKAASIIAAWTAAIAARFGAILRARFGDLGALPDLGADQRAALDRVFARQLAP
ncbi:MAG: hypothetical protein AAF318_01240 [Pseudomonadota bacterium]